MDSINDLDEVAGNAPYPVAPRWALFAYCGIDRSQHRFAARGLQTQRVIPWNRPLLLSLKPIVGDSLELACPPSLSSRFRSRYELICWNRRFETNAFRLEPEPKTGLSSRCLLERSLVFPTHHPSPERMSEAY
jgi:hypothetical protein